MSSEVKIKVGLDSGAVASGLTKVRGQFAEFRSGVTSKFAGLFALGGIQEATRRIIDYGARIGDLSERFGVSSDALQQFGNAAELNGSSLDAVAQAFQKLTINQAKALGGSQEALANFKQLGVSVQDLRTLAPNEIMLKIGSSSLDAAALVGVLGKSSLELRTTLAGLADGTNRLGAVIDKDLIRKLKVADDTFKQLGQTATIRGAQILDVLTKIGAWIAKTGLDPFGKAIVDFSGNPFENKPADARKFPPGAENGAEEGSSGGDAKGAETLRKQLAEITSKAKLDELDAESKITALVIKRVQLLNQADTTGDEKKKLEYLIAAAQVANQISQEQKKAETERDARAKRIVNLQEELSAVQQEASSQQLDTEGKINALIAQRADLLKQAAAADDPEKKLKLQIEAANLAKDIFATQKQFDASLETNVRAPSVAATYLRRIGASVGGFEAAGAGSNDLLSEQKRHGKVLDEIAANTKAKQEVALKMR